jgi:hypothetical protein
VAPLIAKSETRPVPNCSGKNSISLRPDFKTSGLELALFLKRNLKKPLNVELGAREVNFINFTPKSRWVWPMESCMITA